MRVKFTIALCALLVLALGASQAYGQAGGYGVSKSIETVVQHGKNQMVGIIQLDFDTGGGDLDAGETITVTFGGLTIATAGTVDCTSPVDCNAADALEFENDEDTGAGTLTINTTGTAGGTARINLSGTRVDVSSLDAGDEIIATISSTAPTGLIPISQSRRGTVSTVVAEVMPGLEVEIDAASRLICNLDATFDHDGVMNTPEIAVGGVAMITVSEGFDDAWEENGVDQTDTNITIKTLNLPAGVELRWPTTVLFTNPGDENNETWATLTLAADDVTEAGVDETSDEDNDGSEVTYAYSIQDAGEAEDVMDSFAIEIKVVTGDIASGAGGIADIWAFLSPGPSDDDENIGSVLSYVMNPVTDPDTDDGDFLNIAECVTYLLFPYITCGAHADWDTGIAIANTTMDDGIFGHQRGGYCPERVLSLIYAYPTGEKTADDYSTADGLHGETHHVSMISGGLAGGDSVAMACSGDSDVGWNAGLCHRESRLPPCSRNGLRVEYGQRCG